MRRQVFNLAAAASLVLCVTTVALWVRSYWRAEGFNFVNRPNPNVREVQHAVLSARGRLYYNHLLLQSAVARGAPIFEHDGLEWIARKYVASGESADEPLRMWVSSYGREMLGLGYYRRQFIMPADTSTRWGLMVPHWFAALVFAALPARWLLFQHRQRTRRRLGLCQNCGYDLRTTPDRCPECGAVAAVRRGPPHNPPMQRIAREAHGNSV